MKFIVSLLFVIALLNSNTAFADAEDIKEKLLGEHYFSLHYLLNNSDIYGHAIITEVNGTLKILAGQLVDNDYASVSGDVEIINDKHFKVIGQIITKVNYVNNGEPCNQKGEFDFKVQENRKYWRLQKPHSICNGVTHYIDVYFKKF